VSRKPEGYLVHTVLASAKNNIVRTLRLSSRRENSKERREPERYAHQLHELPEAKRRTKFIGRDTGILVTYASICTNTVPGKNFHAKPLQKRGRNQA
jgi:hypothetical protein